MRREGVKEEEKLRGRRKGKRRDGICEGQIHEINKETEKKEEKGRYRFSTKVKNEKGREIGDKKRGREGGDGGRLIEKDRIG